MIRRRLVLVANCMIPICVAIGCGGDVSPAVKMEIRRAEFEPRDGLKEATIEGSNLRVFLHQTVELSNPDIADANGTILEDDAPAISVKFTAKGRRKLARLSKEHQGKPLAIIIDGKLLRAPILRDEIPEDALITGPFASGEIERIVGGLRGEPLIAHARPKQNGFQGPRNDTALGSPEVQQRSVDQPGAAAATTDLQGTWLWTSPDGTRTAPSDKIWAEIAGNRLTITSLQQVSFDFTFALNPNASPKEMDLTDLVRHRYGERLLGIYDLKGDVLRIRIPNDGHAPRPVDIMSPTTAGSALIVLTRKPRE